MLKHFELVGVYFSERMDRRTVLETRRDDTQFEHYADDWDEED